MMKPRNSILIAGRPLVAVPMISLCGFVGVLAVVNDGFGWPMLILLVLGGWFGNCMNVAGQYRAWRRDWDALDPDYRPPRPVRAMGRAVAAVPVFLGCLWLLRHYDDPTSAAHVIAPMLVVGLPLLWIARLVLRRKRRQRNPRAWIVAQAISRPLPAPSVAEAFARLPDYCRSPARKEKP
jgi:hypothetical protein